MRVSSLTSRFGLLFVVSVLTSIGPSAQDQMRENRADLLRPGDRAIKVADAIYMVQGFGNTFLVITRDGNVVIDTSNANHARIHKPLLDAVSAGPVRYIILTHAHGDH